MFSIRQKQLQRQLKTYIQQAKDPELKRFAEYLHLLIFEEYIQARNSNKMRSLLETLYDSMEEIPELAALFSRAISRLATNELKEKNLYELFAVILFARLIIQYLTENEKGEFYDPTDPKSQPQALNMEKYRELTTRLRKLNKIKNSNIVTLEAILDYLLEHAWSQFEQIRNINTWEDLIKYLFNTEWKEKKRRSTLVGENIKEMLLSFGYEGELVEEIYQKYDGLLAFCMGLLTVLNGTKLENEYKEKLNTILDSLGNSPRIKIVQQRLRRNFKERTALLDEIEKIAEGLISELQTLNVTMDKKRIIAFFDNLTSIPRIAKNQKTIRSLEEFEGYYELFSSARLASYKNELKRVWKAYQTNVEEIIGIFNDLNSIFDELIRNANNIITELRIRKFKGTLTKDEQVACEKAGIRISDIISISGGTEISIPEKYFKTLHNLYDRFMVLWDEILSILKKFSQEETISSTLNRDIKVFGVLQRSLKYIMDEMENNGIFKGYKEEVFLNLRILTASYRFLEGIGKSLRPVKDIHLNKANEEKFYVVVSQISSIIEELKKFIKISVYVNELSKLLWRIDPKRCIRLGKDADLLLNPSELENLIKDIPNENTLAYRQRLISKEELEKRKQIFKEIKELVEKIKALPLEERSLIPALDST